MADPRSPDSFDIKFFVGPEKLVVQANKFVLGYHSPVFHRMFFSEFKNENEIVVPDVNVDVFQAMINSISGRAVSLDAENVEEVYYVAEKYDLELLRQMCKTFVVNSVDSTNALALLNQFHHYNVSEINEKCLAIILDEPFNFIDETDFLDASADVIRAILMPIHINCSLGDLKDALSAWMTKQGLNYSESQWFEAVEEHLQISKEQLESKKVRQHLFRKFNFSFTNKNVLETCFTSEAPVFLYGFGLVMGAVLQEPIEIEVVSNGVRHKCVLNVCKEGHQDIVSIQDVFLSKLPMYGVQIHVTLTFTDESETQRACVQCNNHASFVSHLILCEMPKI